MNLTGNIENPTAYLLADHLDAMLAAGEDLLKVHRVVFAEVAKPRQQSIRDLVDVQRRCIDAICALEMRLTMRGLQARERAEELRRTDARLELIAGLFIAGTTPLVDAARELGDWTEFDFQTGDEIAEYLRSRGLIAPDSAGLVSPEQLVVTTGFRVARRIELGPLLDMAATFLDSLELFYELYEDDHADSSPASIGATDEVGTSPEPAV